jgi:hypothetical protein
MGGLLGGRGSSAQEPLRAQGHFGHRQNGGGALARLAAVLAIGVALLVGASSANAAAPLIDASWVTSVSNSGATLRAKVNANGLSTSYRFEYITDAAYQANLNAIPPRAGFFGAAQVPPAGKEGGLGPETKPLTVAQHAQGLTSATNYHYRPVATNKDGQTIGPEHAFTTTTFMNSFKTPPDGRKWEMVSPVNKNGGAITAPGTIFGGGDFQAAAGAAAITYGSVAAFSGAKGAPPVPQYISRRTTSGWVTENASTAVESGAYGDKPDGAPYRVFSTDLSRGLLFGGLPCRGELAGCPSPNPVLPGTGAPPGFMAYYLRESATGAFSSLLTEPDFEDTSVSAENFEVSFAAASSDLTHVVLSSCAKLTANATEVPAGPGKCDPAAQNLYERSSAGLRLVNLLPAGTEGTPGAQIAAPLGAVSEDGLRIYWTQGGSLYLRQGSETLAVDDDPMVGGGGAFQAASTDGGVAFFTKAGHLYRFTVAGETTTDLTPGGGVVGVLGASDAGSTVYYQDATGIKRWEAGIGTSEVVAGAEASLPSNYPPATGTARVSPGGGHLAFLSDVELNGHDNLDANTGAPSTEVYLYGPPLGGGSPQFVCVSCNPTGERPDGSAGIPGAQVNGTTQTYKPRALSADGSRVFFTTLDDLATGDTNSNFDVYQWEALGRGDCVLSPGCLNLISSGRSGGGASFIDATASGDDVYFITDESLVNSDPGSIDLYDARVGGGFVEAQKPIACIGDACQALPSPPDDPTPGTLIQGNGNPRLRFFKETRKHKKPRKRRSHRKKSRGKHQGRKHQGGRRG